jgi:hypothetical protein
MARRVLMIAFHFPPAAMGSGHLRTLGFARHLPALGWDPVVLSAAAMAYPRTVPLAEGVIPPNCEVHRAFALDAGRHLAIGGKYPGLIAQPVRWISWWPAAVRRGMRLIRQGGIDAIWSTYPIMTAHCIAHALAQKSGLPWIADFRDPVSGSVSSENQWAAASQQRWDRRVVLDAASIVFTTPGAMQEYATRYPAAHAAGRFAIIENGYEETDFAALPKCPPRGDRPWVLLHSGLLYANGRNPLPFFTAVARLKAAGYLTAKKIQIILRASGSESTYRDQIARLAIDDLVVLAPPVSNHEALVEQARADALLLFQGSRFNRQIPAKAYEYLRIGHPIFALVDERGDTAEMLRSAGGVSLAPIDDAEAIATQLIAFVSALRSDRAPFAGGDVTRFARSERAKVLAQLLDEVAAPRERQSDDEQFGLSGAGDTMHSSTQFTQPALKGKK